MKVNCVVRLIAVLTPIIAFGFGGNAIDRARAKDDTIAARRKMVADKAYHGLWGVNSEFNIKMFGFMSDGRGIRSGFMMMLPFKWTVREDGTIHCVCDEEYSLMVGSLDPIKFDCRYDADKNQMVISEPSRKPSGAPKKTALPYMDDENDVAEMLKQSEEKKLDPKWKIQVEQLRQQAARLRTSSPAADDLVGGWSGRNDQDSLVINLEKGGTGHAAGGMGIFEARWIIMDNGRICVMTPGYRGDLWKFYFERNPGADQLLCIGKSMVDLNAGVEKPQTGADKMTMHKFSETKNELFKESLKQWRQQLEKSEAKNSNRNLPTRMRREDFFFSEKCGIPEILECFRQYGMISMWREGEGQNSFSISKSHFPGLNMSVFLGGYVYGDDAMKSQFDDSHCSGSNVEKIPVGAKLKRQGADQEFVRKIVDAMKANGVEGKERISVCAKSYYSTFSKNVKFEIKDGDEEKVLMVLVEFMKANGSGKLMVGKWIPDSE